MSKSPLTNEATGISRDADTNDSGDYSSPKSPVGTYTVQIRADGIQENRSKGVIVDVNQVVTLKSTMQIGRPGRLSK